MLESIEGEWDWLDAVTGPLDMDFAAAALEQPRMQERPEIDDVIA